jgi:hypothetical protein
VNRILGITLLVLGLYALTSMPHEIGYLWGGIAGVALGSMLTAFSFSSQRADPDLRIEPRFGEPRLGDAPPPPVDSSATPQATAPIPPAIPIMPVPRPTPLRFKVQAPTPPVHIPRVRVQAPPPPRPPAPSAEQASSAEQEPAAPIPLESPVTNAPGKIATYGWFGAGRNIQMAASLSELMAAIRSGALKPQTSVHRIDGAGKTGPVNAANSDPLLRALFWAAENKVPDKVLPGLVKSLIEDDRQASEPARNTVAS